MYYIIPSGVMAKNVAEANKKWLKLPGAKGQKHKANDVRTVFLQKSDKPWYWDISKYKNNLELITDCVK